MSDYWMCLWVSDFLSRWNLGILFSACVCFVQFVNSEKLVVWMSERDIYMRIQICPLKWDKFEFQRPPATLYLLLQSVADSMDVAVAFPDFSGFLAFRAPNIGFPKSGSNGSFSRANIPRIEMDPRNMSSRTVSPQYFVELRSSWSDLTLSPIQILMLVLNFSSVSDFDFFNVDRIWICLLYLSIKWLSIELTQILYIHSEFYIYERQV